MLVTPEPLIPCQGHYTANQRRFIDKLDELLLCKVDRNKLGMSPAAHAAVPPSAGDAVLGGDYRITPAPGRRKERLCSRRRPTLCSRRRPRRSIFMLRLRRDGAGSVYARAAVHLRLFETAAIIVLCLRRPPSVRRREHLGAKHQPLINIGDRNNGSNPFIVEART